MVDTVILKATQSGNLSYFQQNVKFKDTKAAMLHYFHKKSGDTLTHIACRFGHTHILSLLLDEGFSLEAENFDGKTALHEAAQATNFECVGFLIHAGANVDALKRADW